MNKFGLRIFIFSSPALVFVILTLIFYYFSRIKAESKFREISTYQCLLMGDSQVQRLNGELISQAVKNIASSAEHYYFTYNKLRKLVKYKNHKIEKVLLGVSLHNFAPVYNRLFNIDFPEGKNSFERYLYFITLSDNSKFTNHLGQLPISNLILGIYSKPDWGGDNESSNSNPTLKLIKRSIDMHFSIQRNENKFSYDQRTYLYKIDSLCLVNNIDLTLISTPYHSGYKDQVKPEYYDFLTETLSKLSNRNYISFLSDNTDGKFMSDANHLNKVGAKYYSEMIGEKLKVRVHNRIDDCEL